MEAFITVVIMGMLTMVFGAAAFRHGYDIGEQDGYFRGLDEKEGEKYDSDD